MKASTELLLYELWWFGETLLSPRLAKRIQSFETWCSYNGLLRQIQRLENQALVEVDKKQRYGRLVSLNAKALDHLAFQEDFTRRHASDWNGNWTLVLFDIREEDRKLRNQIRIALQKRKFGCLQKSLWISPFSDPQILSFLNDTTPDSRHVTVFEGRNILGHTPKKIVQSAWDFHAVNTAYQEMDAILSKMDTLLKEGSLPSLPGLIPGELACWKKARHLDPFLPNFLCPRDYAGPRLWKKRRQLHNRISQLRLFGQ